VAIRVKPNAAGIRRSRPGLAFKHAFEIGPASKTRLLLTIDQRHSAAVILRRCGR
jgi:hypothetical protein